MGFLAAMTIPTQPCAVVSIFQKLHQGYLSMVRLLGAFGDFIGNDEYAWCMGGLFSFLKCVLGE